MKNEEIQKLRAQLCLEKQKCLALQVVNSNLKSRNDRLWEILKQNITLASDVAYEKNNHLISRDIYNLRNLIEQVLGEYNDI